MNRNRHQQTSKEMKSRIQRLSGIVFYVISLSLFQYNLSSSHLMYKLFLILTCYYTITIPYTCSIAHTGFQRFDGTKNSTSDLINRATTPSYFDFVQLLVIWEKRSTPVLQWSQVLKLQIDTKIIQRLYLLTK